MRYLLLNILVLIIVFAIAGSTKQLRSRAALVSLLSILGLTAVFDSIIILTGIVDYNPQHIIGLYVWRAPIEDFAYAVASVALVILIWEHYDKTK